VRLQFADSGCYQRALGTLRTVRADERLRTIEVGTDGSAASVYELLGLLQTAGAPAARVSVDRPGLDDVFRSLTASRPGPASRPAAAHDHQAPDRQAHDQKAGVR
jgi:hypothetical protein